MIKSDMNLSKHLLGSVAVRLGIVLLSIAVLLLVVAQEVPDKKANLTRADREAWLELLQWPQFYEEAYAQTHPFVAADDPGGITFWGLEPSRYLVEVQTYLAAYQAAHIYLVYDEAFGEVSMLGFSTVSETDGAYRLGATVEMAGLSTFDEEEGVLEIFSLARGLGDCGTLARYRIERFSTELLSARSQACSDDPGSAVLDPTAWPLVWPPGAP